MRYYDAHLHLQDPRFGNHREEILSKIENSDIAECVVNGTSPSDWKQVSALSKHPKIRPAFGLHPWRVEEASEDWFALLQSNLSLHEGALIGEIGLDKWIRNPQFEKQIVIFEKQIQLAAALDLPPTIHCLKAWGPMLATLEKTHKFLPGFLLHSYSGPIDMVDNFVEMGAYFSISGYFARPDKVKKLEAWKRIPVDRILIETDAPDMNPPSSLLLECLSDDDGNNLNHPANLLSIYRWAAKLLQMEEEALAKQIESNYRRLFGSV